MSEFVPPLWLWLPPVATVEDLKASWNLIDGSLALDHCTPDTGSVVPKDLARDHKENFRRIRVNKDDEFWFVLFEKCSIILQIVQLCNSPN